MKKGLIEPFSVDELNYTLKNRHIIADPQEPSPCRIGLGVKIRKNLASLAGRTTVLLVAVSITLSIGPTAYAGFIGSVAGFFGWGGGSYSKDYIDNSQNMTVLTAALNHDPNPAKGGGGIVIEEDALVAAVGPMGSLVDVENEKPASDQISLYVVRQGDTLSEIAKMFDVSVNTIWWANDLKHTAQGHPNIVPGQELVILPTDGIFYTVKNGGTMADVAKKYDASAQEIANYNGLPLNAKLSKGDELFVPGAHLKITKPKATGTSRLTGAGGPSIPGYYIYPIPAGARKTQGLHGRNAVDLGAPLGTSVVASASGKVLIARTGSWYGGYGNTVVIDHPNGTQTLYSHLSKVYVWGGQSVVAGQVIGTVGSTGRSTGPHLHFEIRGAKNPF